MTPSHRPRSHGVFDVVFALWCIVALLGSLLATVWLLPGA
jgi:hypothetical protein